VIDNLRTVWQPDDHGREIGSTWLKVSEPVPLEQPATSRGWALLKLAG
jgi:hypothetical protein